ncbi:hypothetical protein [Bacillus sp. FJAT-26390]|uniref:hypothetical protein n=1 Tax=Bacillus sp. FJAT-26390 TaxID=1743142 RepID=UPI000807F816|nr:hypothetical protein [Bacillus sp. FJAT-26390]OBZ08181.1 hypothetical protein A7975_28110 [Bacillus sp. FJAT-26390]
MEQQQTGKRSIALPITLVILVFSLIGNVFLYSQFLQHKQENNFVKGQKIFAAAMESKQYVDEMIPVLDAMLQSKSLEERLNVKFDAGRVTAKGNAVAKLTEEAASVSAEPEKFSSESTLAFLANAEKGLQSLGSYNGALNEEEQSYATGLKSSFEAMSETMNGFNTSIADNRIALIRLSSGLDWIDLVSKLQETMKSASK